MDKLTDLIDRLSALTGPDRECDALIWAHFDGRTVSEEKGMLLARNSRPPHDECVLGYIDPGKHSRNFTPVREDCNPVFPVTASLDSAIALGERVLPGWGFYLRRDKDTSGSGMVFPEYPRVTPCHAEAATPALALVLAILRAHQSKDAS